ncbi:MAG: hypothetical protein WCL16_00240 [bacterium]
MFKVNRVMSAAIGLIALGLPLTALTSTNTAVAPSGANDAIYSLEQFGPVETATSANQTLQTASEAIIAAGGGIILIPANAAAGWTPRNNSQKELRIPPPPDPAKSWRPGVGVTIIDARGITPKILPPQATGLTIERVLNLPTGESLPFWGYYPMLHIQNTVLRGSTSYRDWLQADVKPGKDQRFYVATIRGVFPGMFMSVGEYGTVERLYVKSLGYDKEKKLWYFVADTNAGQRKGSIFSNKNHVNILDMDTYSHNENQTFDVRMWRHNYSQGDNYLFDARFKYMGDVHSTSGDENGVIYAAFIESLTGIFRGQVDKWNSGTGELVYKGSDLGKTLGSGRPIINLNPAKWITNGTVMIVSPASFTEVSLTFSNAAFQGKTYPTTIEKNPIGHSVLRMGGLIHFSADAEVGNDVVGRYFAVDEDGEYVPKTAAVRRWYLIDSVTVNADGTKDLRIIRHWWGAKSAGSPTLYKPDNYSWDGHLKALRYIIAPGANAYDVADGVNNPKHLIRLSPSPFAGTKADFEPGDKIEQAIGPDPFKPTPFRSWIWDQVPGVFPSSVFDIANNGAVMRDSLLWVHGNSVGDIVRDREFHYDRNPAWDKIIRIESACNTGIRFGADTADAAILFAQPFHLQPVKWYYGIESNKPPQVASLTVSRETGEFNLVGGGLRVEGPIATTGLSGDATPARNLRGKDVGVKTGETSVTITFANPELDPSYAVFVEQNWLCNRAIMKKDARGFTVQFEKPAPADARLDWMIVR